MNSIPAMNGKIVNVFKKQTYYFGVNSRFPS
jgi:hypothetical protein